MVRRERWLFDILALCALPKASITTIYVQLHPLPNRTIMFTPSGDRWWLKYDWSKQIVDDSHRYRKRRNAEFPSQSAGAIFNRH
jgi:hypothetical protein